MSVLNNDVNALETFLEDGLSYNAVDRCDRRRHRADPRWLKRPLTVVTLLPIPLLAAFTLLFTRLIEPRYLSIREEIGDLNSRLENNVSGIEVIKSEGAEQFETERVAEASDEYLAANLSAIKVRITYFPG